MRLETEYLIILSIDKASTMEVLNDYKKCWQYEKTPREVNVTKKSKRRLTIECDEMRCAELAEVWSFVQNLC